MVIVVPTATKWIIDSVVRANRPDKLIPVTLLVAAAFFLQHAFDALRIILNSTFEQKALFDLRSDLYSHIQVLPLRWFDNRANWRSDDTRNRRCRLSRARANGRDRPRRECSSANAHRHTR